MVLLRFMKMVRTSRGLIAIGAALAAVSILLTWVGALSLQVLQKNRLATRLMHKRRVSVVMESIAARAVADLRTKYHGSPLPHSLNYLIANNEEFSPIQPKVYWKGLFQLDLLDENGRPSGVFEAPENNPTVRIEAGSCNPAALIPYCYFKVIVQTDLCQELVPQRTKISTTEPPAPLPDPAWQPACSVAKRQNAERQFFINTEAPAFNGG